ncbi:MAG: UDP-N-acetylmuramoyl-tripeptide--D-alanyl-D-alanine ligase [Pseudomonadales bacterium]|nr:UDP-N-acetylmuramoyl-tripeptide--D-alanyl-D-alanine ligase [Pseudomonadales bacterium]NIX08205.1 UDP-N-acetylmuramoyl-tripeptide--D-alanyl-D-alanine ligase [Pseudomonadales bacterium]
MSGEASPPLWTWPALCRALRLEARDGPDVTGIVIDSRKAGPGDLFIALTGDPGPRFNPSSRSDRDGHDFIDAAIAAGAAGVLAHDGAARDVPQLQVPDTLDGLWALGAAARARLRCPVVAITGSSGKTTTKGMLAAALGAFSTEGSLNNHLGVPLSLALSPADASAAVFEIGTNHPGEIAPLSVLVRPDVAVVLNVHPAHAENFVDLDELRIEKLSINKGLEGKGHFVVEDGVAVHDLPSGLVLVRFGRREGSDVRLLEVHGQTAAYRIGGERFTAHVPGGGEHRAASLAAVLAVLMALHRPVSDGLQLGDDLVPKGRGDESLINGVTVVDDSYNANPESMKAALRTLSAASGRTVAVLGDMLELGAEGPDHHRGLATHCRGIDRVYCVGEAMRELFDALPEAQRAAWLPDAGGDSLIVAILGELRSGDRILIKGSNRVFWAAGFVGRFSERLRTLTISE